MGTIIIVYLVFLLIVMIAGGAGVYHGFSFGLPGDRSRLGVLVYLAAVIVIVVLSFVVIGTMDTGGG